MYIIYLIDIIIKHNNSASSYFYAYYSELNMRLDGIKLYILKNYLV